MGYCQKHLETFLEYVHSMGYALYRDKDDNVHKSIYELYQYYTDEIIWATPYNHYYSIASNMEPRTNPRDLDGTSAWGNVGVFQESVDAFFTANGLEIEEDPEYSETEFASLKISPTKICIQIPTSIACITIVNHVFTHLSYIKEEVGMYNHKTSRTIR